MIDPKKQAEFDQSMTLMLEMLPPMLYGFYTKLQSEGFTKAEAFSLVRDSLRSLFQGGDK